jgi:hypothetical protein
LYIKKENLHCHDSNYKKSIEVAKDQKEGCNLSNNVVVVAAAAVGSN